MPALRQSVKRPKTLVAAAVAALILLVAADSFRRPSAQASARAYIGAVHFYQHALHPLLHGRVRCRYSPTCSRYSIQAVQTHGIQRGLALTFKRLYSCRASVPLGTSDPVPPPTTDAQASNSSAQTSP